MPVELSRFAKSLSEESAFTVLSMVRELQAAGKDIVELEIGDSPFAPPAVAAKVCAQALADNVSYYCPSLGLPEFRDEAAAFVQREFGIPATRDNIAIAPGAKPFEQLFCEAFLNPGDGVLVFSPHFPTYPPNVERRGARVILRPLLSENRFRPQLADIDDFLANDPAPKAIFLNSPHNPTGGVMTARDCEDIAKRLQSTDVAVFSDEPYCHMVWSGSHHSITAQPEMLKRTMAAYTFSKSYSMSGWRLGFCVAAPEVIRAVGLMINSSLSCSPPMLQLAGAAVLKDGHDERDTAMDKFRTKVQLLSDGLNSIPGIRSPEPAGTFYVFPDVRELCDRIQMSSQQLALYLLKHADPNFGVACLGGECFGSAGAGHLRFSCAEPDDRLLKAVEFIRTAVVDEARLTAFRATPDFQPCG